MSPYTHGWSSATNSWSISRVPTSDRVWKLISILCSKILTRRCDLSSNDYGRSATPFPLSPFHWSSWPSSRDYGTSKCWRNWQPMTSRTFHNCSTTVAEGRTWHSRFEPKAQGAVAASSSGHLVAFIWLFEQIMMFQTIFHSGAACDGILIFVEHWLICQTVDTNGHNIYFLPKLLESKLWHIQINISMDFHSITFHSGC
jgi:hypothetical protein